MAEMTKSEIEAKLEEIEAKQREIPKAKIPASEKAKAIKDLKEERKSLSEQLRAMPEEAKAEPKDEEEKAPEAEEAPKEKAPEAPADEDDEFMKRMQEAKEKPETPSETSENETNEFNGKDDEEDDDENADPTMPKFIKGRHKRAKEPIEVNITKKDKDGNIIVDKDGRVKLFNKYRIYTDKGVLTEELYEVVYVNELTDTGKERIENANKEIIEKVKETEAKLKTASGNNVALKQYLGTRSYWVCPATPNDTGVQVGIRMKSGESDVSLKIATPFINEKGPGTVKAHLVLVPERCYDAITSDDILTDEMVEEIVNDPRPKMKVVILSPSDYILFQLGKVSRPIPVMPGLFDKSGKYFTPDEIPEMKGFKAGAECIRYDIDPAKIKLVDSTLTRRDGETEERFKNRLKAKEHVGEMLKRLRNKDLPVVDRVPLIKISSNVRTNIVTAENFLPLATFAKEKAFSVMSKEKAVDMNNVYFHKHQGDIANNQFVPSQEYKDMLTVAGKRIISSFVFPSSPEDAIPTLKVKSYYKVRTKKDDKAAKYEYPPETIIKKYLKEKKDGTGKTVATLKVGINDVINGERYNSSRYENIKKAFENFVNSKSDIMEGCEFPTLEQLAATTKNTKSSKPRTHKISDTGFDSDYYDAELIMRDLGSEAGGNLSLLITDTRKEISGVKVTNITKRERVRRVKQDDLEAAID